MNALTKVTGNSDLNVMTSSKIWMSTNFQDPEQVVIVIGSKRKSYKIALKEAVMELKQLLLQVLIANENSDSLIVYKARK